MIVAHDRYDANLPQKETNNIERTVAQTSAGFKLQNLGKCYNESSYSISESFNEKRLTGKFSENALAKGSLQ